MKEDKILPACSLYTAETAPPVHFQSTRVDWKSLFALCKYNIHPDKKAEGTFNRWTSVPNSIHTQQVISLPQSAQKFEREH